MADGVSLSIFFMVELLMTSVEQMGHMIVPGSDTGQEKRAVVAGSSGSYEKPIGEHLSQTGLAHGVPHLRVNPW